MQSHQDRPDSPTANGPSFASTAQSGGEVSTAVSVLEPYTPPNVPHGSTPRGALRHPLQHGPASRGAVPDHHDRPIRGRARGGVSGQLHPVRDLPHRVPSHRRALDQPGRRRGDTAQGTRERREGPQIQHLRLPGRGPGIGCHCQWAIRTPTP